MSCFWYTKSVMDCRGAAYRGVGRPSRGVWYLSPHLGRGVTRSWSSTCEGKRTTRPLPLALPISAAPQTPEGYGRNSSNPLRGIRLRQTPDRLSAFGGRLRGGVAMRGIYVGAYSEDGFISWLPCACGRPLLGHPRTAGRPGRRGLVKVVSLRYW